VQTDRQVMSFDPTPNRNSFRSSACINGALTMMRDVTQFVYQTVAVAILLL
jgi:hypothetical protein